MSTPMHHHLPHVHPPHKIIIKMSYPQILSKSKNHELSYEGCRCGLCEKVSLN